MAKTARFRFLQTSDLHIGCGRARWGEAVALERAEAMLDRIYSIAKEKKCDATLMAGDIFDNKSVFPSERNLFARAVTKYSGRGGMLTGISLGNHDMLKPGVSNLDWLSILAEKEIDNLHVTECNEPKIVDVADGLRVALVPANLSEDQKWIERWVKQARKEPWQYVFVGHALVRGCKVDNGEVLGDDRSLSLERAGKSSRVVWWAYGDIHLAQRLPTLPRKNGAYAGSPIQMKFDEKPGRGVLVITLAKTVDGWVVESREKVLVDNDPAIRPLVTIVDAEDKSPSNALIKVAPGVVLDKKRRAAIVGTIVEDHSEAPDREAVEKGLAEVVPFDAAIAAPADIAADLTSTMRKAFPKDSRNAKAFAAAVRGLPSIVDAAVASYRDRGIQ